MNWRDQIDINEDGSVENHCYDTRELWLKTEQELYDTKKKFHSYLEDKDLEIYIDETVSLANRIERYEILPDPNSLPAFETGGLNPNKYLINQCKLHRDWKKVKTDPVYKKRFWYEWGILLNCKFSDYFLVVNDIVKEARRRRIPYNARGSACGSLIGYLLGITWVDPIRFDTPFERFLTEDRQNLPDIDMDFARSGRETMIRYLQDKYGEENVVHITNIVRFQPKGVIKDMARVFGLNFQYVNSITKKIPDNSSWEEVLKHPEIIETFNQNPKMGQICETLLGVNKHKGVHASGIILTPTKCTDWAPICYATDRSGKTGKKCKTTEWDMKRS
jgi:DNA polymerase-3 subunit alpha